MPNPQLSWRTDDFLSGLSPLADQSQFWSIGNSLFALTWLSHINVAQEPWRGHACIGLSGDIRHYSSFISMLLSARCTPSRPSYSFGSREPNIVNVIKSGILRRAGHVVRMDENELSKKISWTNRGGQWRCGRPKSIWMDRVEEDTRKMGYRMYTGMEQSQNTAVE